MQNISIRTARGKPIKWTAAGHATLSGGRGNDTLAATGNDNTFVYATGDGTDHVTTGGTGNVLALGPGLAAADLKLGLGSLALQVGSDPNDLIHFDSFDPANALATQPFDSIEFDDGTTMTYADLLAQGFDLAGTAGNDVIDDLRRYLATTECRLWQDRERGMNSSNDTEWRIAA